MADATDLQQGFSMTRDRALTWTLVTVWLMVAVATTSAGLPYYQLPMLARIDSPFHEALRPAGSVGHLYGILGTAMMTVGVLGYSMRRRVGWLTGAGRLRNWLQVHIFLCTLGPFLIVVHTTLKLGGIVSIAFWSMSIVVLSGFFGRYVYARIPHGVEGNVRELADLAEESRALEARLRADAAIPEEGLADLLVVPRTPDPRGALHALALSFTGGIADRLHRRRARALLERRNVPRDHQREVLDLVQRRRRLLRAGTLSRSFRRMFGSWHLLHLPLAILLAIVTILHIAVAYMFGYA